MLRPLLSMSFQLPRIAKPSGTDSNGGQIGRFWWEVQLPRIAKPSGTGWTASGGCSSSSRFQLPRIAKPSGTGLAATIEAIESKFQLPRIAKPSGTLGFDARWGVLGGFNFPG